MADTALNVIVAVTDNSAAIQNYTSCEASKTGLDLKEVIFLA